jgi:PhnB protein
MPQSKTAASQVTHNLSPHLVCAGAADAIEFYKRAFGAEEMIRIPTDDNKILHAALMINGATVMLTDENRRYGALSPKALNGTPVVLHLNVPDVDAFVERAVAAGAKIVMPVQDMFWGDRYGQIEDPHGHRWSIATHLRDMTEAELKEAARKAMSGKG